MNGTPKGARGGDPSAVRPILISAGNSLEMTGAPWHYWRRHAAEFGLEFVTLGSKRFIRADRLLAVLEARSSVVSPAEADEADELTAFRDRVRRAG